MILQEYLKDYKDSLFVFAIVSGAIAFIVTFTLDMFFSTLYSLINDYRRTKPVTLPEKIISVSTKKVPNKRSSNKSSKKIMYDNGGRGKKYNYIKEI
ncbi:hypothetical protein RCL_jg12848.t1 [Rhizophagus clarus]|uniref:Uncharacterized protein n=1 Tax=Rhizophagus clarus TaxID=94130 RepID=A0A8H3KXL1_9GLOM|nr:hypothetical protein RCL_jg12848.t1 [Rhizophagus clarus]